MKLAGELLPNHDWQACQVYDPQRVSYWANLLGFLCTVCFFAIRLPRIWKVCSHSCLLSVPNLGAIIWPAL